MNKSQRRAEQLGMSHGAAGSRLKKQLLFKYVQLANENWCYKCGAQIESVDDFSIEHKLPWENRDTSLFWDLDNIAFSHLSCNRPHIYAPKKSEHKDGCKRCSKCKQWIPLDQFVKYRGSWDGLYCHCKNCHKQWRQ